MNMLHKNTEIEQIVKERDQAFIDAVTKDDWQGVMKYAKKYGVRLSANKNIMKAAIYKAVQCCTDIPEDVKALAAQKCTELGFNPTIM